ncbi:MAG: hypothetical protein E7295_11000 [Lachnospiraceae bacterium]|jgi:hypothetical protein|nr:hypothetical protein [Lachnospiraceae bacterium]
MKKLLDKNRIPICIALLQWMITIILQVDRLFFTYSEINHVQVLVKASYLIALVLTWCSLFHVVRKCKEGNQCYKRGILYFVSYFTFTMVIMIIIWPGTWFWDDLITLMAISSYQLDVWHHVLTGAYQAVLLQLLPFPAGMLIIQNCIISVIVSYVIVKLEGLFHLRKDYHPFIILIKMLPFMLPPVLAYQYSGFRLGIYSYVELLFLVALISTIIEKRRWNIKLLLLICFLCAVTAAWRTESIFYVPITCLVVGLLPSSLISKRKKAYFAILSISIFSAIFLWQKVELRNDDYFIISLVNPCTELVKASDLKEDQELLEEIGKIVNIEVIHQNPRMTGEKMYWNRGLGVKNYTKEEYHDFLKAMIMLTMRHPQVFWADRWNTFLKSIEFSEITNTNLYDAYDHFSKNEMMEQAKEKNWFAFSPFFSDARRTLIYLWRGKNKSGVIMPHYMRLVWNAVIPMLLLIYAWLKLLQKKKYLLSMLLGAFLIKIPIIFLMEPEGYLLYFLSFYLIGYVYGCFKFACIMNKFVVK